ncbi:MAG: carboxypeptidase-like regulatory domain-containing protein [Planctomycetota bacterium]|jgi:hypothetical protein
MKSLAEIKRSIKKFRIKPAAETKEKTLADVLKAQEDARKTESPAMWRIVGAGITKLGVATVIIIAVAVGVKMLADYVGPPDKKTDRQQETPHKQITVDNSREKLDAELNDVERMFADGNLAGLLEMLDKGQWETKNAAAGYLAKIGDSSAVGPLENLAEKWQGDPEDNPFAAAVSEIRERLKEEDTELTIPTTPARETINCSGIVVDVNDNPIEGVDVRAELYYSGYYSEWRIFAETAARVMTDGSGQFKLSAPAAKYGMHHILVFEHPEFPTAWSHVRQNIRIHMADAESKCVAGQVIDEEGNVIEGAAVQALIKRHPPYSISGGEVTITTRTDSEGRFLFGKICEGARLHIDVWKEGYMRYSTQSLGRDSYPIRAGMDDLLVTLEPGGTIIGHLTSQGKPYRREGILVAARRTGSAANGQAVTDKNGHFRISGLDPKRRHTLTISEKFFEGAGLICKPAENIQAGPGEKAKVALELQPGVPVTVRIVDSGTGTGVQNQFFSVVLWDPNYRETRRPVNIRVADGRTDDSGRSVLMLTPNEAYQLHTDEWDAQNERKEELSHAFGVDADSNQVSVEVSISPHPRLYGRLVDTEGEPVEGQVTAAGERAISNSAGNFALSLSHRAYMSRAGYAFDKGRKIGRAFFCRDMIDANETEIILEPLVDIVGRVVDPNGEGLADALPKIGILTSNGRWYRERGAWWKTEVGKDGWFRIKGVPVGVPMVVSVTMPGAPPDVILDRLQPGDEIDVGDIVVKREELKRLREPDDPGWNATLSGLVTDEHGDPVIGTYVEIVFGKRLSSDFTDIDGRYRLTGLPNGEKLRLNVKHPRTPASHDVICDGNDFDVRLLPTEPK